MLRQAESISFFISSIRSGISFPKPFLTRDRNLNCLNKLGIQQTLKTSINRFLQEQLQVEEQIHSIDIFRLVRRIKL